MDSAHPIPLLQIDAFTSSPFGGNPAAVCRLREPVGDDWLLHVAQEMNLSETAFLLPEQDGYRLRWFTPAIEVDLCGHATLASAHALQEWGEWDGRQPLRFYSRSGPLAARRDGDWIELDFPSRPGQACVVPPGLEEALGLHAVDAVRFKDDLLIEIESEADLRALRPDFQTLAQLPVRGVTVTARSQEYDFVSRFFAPRMGINEDPVTGSSHTRLVPYWNARLGKTRMLAFQASARGGVLRVELDGDRVRMAGQAVTVLRGELRACAGWSKDGAQPGVKAALPRSNPFSAIS